VELTKRLLPAAFVLALAAGARAQAPDTFGTGIAYYTVDASELNPAFSDDLYAGTDTLRYSTNGAGFRLAASIHLPSGAVPVSMQLYYYDTTASGSAIAALAICSNAAGVCGAASSSGGCVDGGATVCSGTAAANGYSSAFATVGGFTIDNYAHQYLVVAGTTTQDGSTAISSVRIGYTLQVSPAPGSASFNDVPTSNPFFQYVEALYASGITGGCGGGNYCPDAPLTRGQMAVFLSKALGLQFN